MREVIYFEIIFIIQFRNSFDFGDDDRLFFLSVTFLSYIKSKNDETSSLANNVLR
jgi:hypothetical protein